MDQQITIVTAEFDRIIQQIRRRHIPVAWSILVHHIGHDRAIPKPDLVDQVRQRIGRPKYHERNVRKLCEIIRAAGIPICSDRTGYWIGSPDEIMYWARWYSAHATTMLQTMRRLVKVAAALTDDDSMRQDAQALGVRIENAIQTTLNLKM